MRTLFPDSKEKVHFVIPPFGVVSKIVTISQRSYQTLIKLRYVATIKVNNVNIIKNHLTAHKWTPKSVWQEQNANPALPKACLKGAGAALSGWGAVRLRSTSWLRSRVSCFSSACHKVTVRKGILLMTSLPVLLAMFSRKLFQDFSLETCFSASSPSRGQASAGQFDVCPLSVPGYAPRKVLCIEKEPYTPTLTISTLGRLRPETSLDYTTKVSGRRKSPGSWF